MRWKVKQSESWKKKRKKEKKKEIGKDVDDVVHEGKQTNMFSCYWFKGFGSYLLALVSNSN